MRASVLVVGLVFLLGLPLRGTAQSQILSILGTSPGDDFGSRIVAVGDVNGDGKADLAIAAPALASTLVSGPLPTVRIFSGADGSTLLLLTGDGDDQYGSALAAAGDVDLDGIVDLVISAPGNPGGTDRVELRSGADGHLLQQWDGKAGAGTDERFGAAVASAVDADVDGVPDVLVGAPGSGLLKIFSNVKLFSGATGTAIMVAPSTIPLVDFGASVCFLPDQSGDGLPDVLVGAPGLTAGSNHPGQITALAGSSGAVLQTINGTLYQRLGTSLRRTPDLSGDGLDDVLVGADGLPHQIEYRDGVTLGSFWGIDVPGDSSPADPAKACPYVAPWGTWIDLLVATDAGQGGTTQNGAVILFDGFDASPQYIFKGSPGEAIGTAVEAVGDTNGDGDADFAIGSRIGAAPALGRVVVMSAWGQNPTVEFGTGCPGAGGFTPHLWSLSYPGPGLTLDLRVTQSLGGAQGLLLLGLLPAYLPLSNGCELHVAPLLPISVPFVLTGSGPGHGQFELQALLPWNIPPGLTFSIQAFVSDPFAPGKKCASNGLQIAIE
jgi:hypothetical protein